MGHHFRWDERAIGILTEMLKERKSFSEIGRRLGITRNAALGKAHRLGLQSAWRPGPNRASERKRLRRLRREAQRELSVTELVPSIATKKRTYFNFKNDNTPIIPRTDYRPIIEDRQPLIRDIAELTDKTCRWPIGEVGKPGFGYCGCEPVPGLPYCERDALRAYEMPKARRVVTAAPVAAKEKEPA